MQSSLKELYGKRLGTSDGEVGEVEDFYFNDQQWAVRYVVVNTGAWLSGRMVLISPHAFSDLHRSGDCLLVNLTREQIENSPPIELHAPVSRQYEQEYYRHYGWPAYWDGGEMWGISGFPVAPPPTEIVGGQTDRGSDDPHLRSTRALKGYHIQTNGGAIGEVVDFLIDNKSWEIRHLVLETGHWYSRKEIVISPRHIASISYEESTVHVTVTKESILEAPEYHAVPVERDETERVA